MPLWTEVRDSAPRRLGARRASWAKMAFARDLRAVMKAWTMMPLSRSTADSKRLPFSGCGTRKATKLGGEEGRKRRQAGRRREIRKTTQQSVRRLNHCVGARLCVFRAKILGGLGLSYAGWIRCQTRAVERLIRLTVFSDVQTSTSCTGFRRCSW